MTVYAACSGALTAFSQNSNFENFGLKMYIGLVTPNGSFRKSLTQSSLSWAFRGNTAAAANQSTSIITLEAEIYIDGSLSWLPPNPQRQRPAPVGRLTFARCGIRDTDNLPQPVERHDACEAHLLAGPLLLKHLLGPQRCMGSKECVSCLAFLGWYQPRLLVLIGAAR